MHESAAQIIHLDSGATSYIMSVLPTGHLAQVYYGPRLGPLADVASLCGEPCADVAHGGDRQVPPYGTIINVDEAWPGIGLDEVRLEFSGPGTGDYREPAVELVFADGSRTVDFRIESVKTYDGTARLPDEPDQSSLPGAIAVSTSQPAPQFAAGDRATNRDRAANGDRATNRDTVVGDRATAGDRAAI